MDKEDFCNKYLDLIGNQYSGINLTRITDLEEFKVKQYEDSISILKYFKNDLVAASKVIDIGFGGGFPILPLANELKSQKFIGLEARNKKVITVGEISKELGLFNTEFQHCRYQDYDFNNGDIVITKAVGKVTDILNAMSTRKEIIVIFYKGPKYFTEEALMLQTINKKWKKIILEKYNLSNGDERVIVGYKNVPRGTKQKSNK
mgnify:CR=1 FL=1